MIFTLAASGALGAPTSVSLPPFQISTAMSPTDESAAIVAASPIAPGEISIGIRIGMNPHPESVMLASAP